MKVFLYEHLTGGWFSDPPADSLLREGEAMRRAVVADLLSCPGTEVVLLGRSESDCLEFASANVLIARDQPSWRDSYFDAVTNSDAVILIAPETAGELEKLARVVERSKGRLLSPSAPFIEIASDKQRTVEVLAKAGLPTPDGVVWKAGEMLPAGIKFPAVVKPLDGCGSIGVRYVSNGTELPLNDGLWRIESFCRGLPASVAVLCGPDSRFEPLPACSQRISPPTFEYSGGSLPLPDALNQRAQRLAVAAVKAIAQQCGGNVAGYVGVDLILGESRHGECDYLVEVNPRITTSYVGLRAAFNGNLADAMLTIATGRRVPLEFNSVRIEFDASGNVSRS